MMQTMLWILLVAIVWLVPMVACALEQGLLGRAAALLAKGWRRKALPAQLFLIVFVAVFVIRGGAKQARSGDDGQLRRPHCNDLAGDCFVPRNDGEGEFGMRNSEFGIDGEGEFGMRNSEFGIGGGSRTNGVWFADFAVISNRCVGFEVAWAYDAFDEAESRGVDLFMSAELTNNWFWVNRYEMPTGTNGCTLVVGGDSVPAESAESFINAFGSCAFFTLGLDVDSDGDLLTDAYERLVVGSSPTEADSDGDGLDDGWEIAHGLNARNAGDAYADFDDDGIPNLYEFANGGDPSVADGWKVRKIIAGNVSASNGVATLRKAFEVATPYCVIEVADGVHSGGDWVGLRMPEFPVLLTSANNGRSRCAILVDDCNVAALHLDGNQSNHTIVQGLRIVIARTNNLQAAFWCGGHHILHDVASSAVFRNIDVVMRGASAPQYGWYFVNYSDESSVVAGCRIDAGGNASEGTRGIWSVAGSPLVVENCTFLNFPSNTPAVLCQSVSTNLWNAPDGIPLEIVNCHFDDSFTNAYAFARLEQAVSFNVVMENCLLPGGLYYKYLPDAANGLHYGNAPLDRFGAVVGDSPLAGRASPPRYSVCDIDGEPWRDAPSIGADEYYAVTNLVVDTDGDGLTDWRERHETGTSPFLADCDMDGLTDGEEVEWGTDPVDAQSYSHKVKVTVSDVFSLPGETNHLFVTTNRLAWVGEFGEATFTGRYDNVYFVPRSVTNVYCKLFRDWNGNGIYDSNLETLTNVNVVLRGSCIEAIISLGYIDNDNDHIYDNWENRHGLSPKNAQDGWADDDADGLINVHEFWLDRDPLVVDPTNTILHLLSDSIDKRLCDNTTADDKNTLLPKFKPYAEGNWEINTNCWAYGVDTSCASMWNADWKNRRTVTAVSKRHVISAEHYYVTNNVDVYFCGTDGNVYTNKVVDGQRVAGTDIRVLLLEEELPDAVTIAQVMPTNFMSYIGTGIGLPILYFDQEEKAIVSEITGMDQSHWDKRVCYGGNPRKAIRRPYFEGLIGHDSGDPIFFVADDNVVMIAEILWITHSPFMGFFANEIQERMDALCPGYSLHYFDMSSFEQIQIERVKQ